MSIIEIILLSIGLAMDSFAVAVASSVCRNKYEWLRILRIGLFFGLFQGGMPLIGWCLGIGFEYYISLLDHWIAIVALSYIGGKMIYEGLKPKNMDENIDSKLNIRSPYTSMKVLVTLAIATSIDALVSGFIFVPYGNLIFTAAAIIFSGSFVLSILGCLIGIYFGKRFKVNVEVFGGVILIAIGLKIFVEHMFL